MISLKSGVKLKGLQPQILLALLVAEGVYRAFGPAEVVVTSCNDSKHKDGSYHYKGLAVDLRIKHVAQERRGQIVEQLGQRLGEEFDVLWEGKGQDHEHLHLEYDAG